VLAALGALFAPEVQRYAAERRLGYATGAFRGLLDRTGDPETARNIQELGAVALSTTGSLPGDPRPWILGGSAFLVTGQPVPALEDYREALATGERAEIDLNLGRAFAMLKRQDDARAALLRAGWVSPEILASLPPAAKDPILLEVERLARQLHEGRLDAPPRLP
jgi:hypothetical protein